jgi:hypothetical protein
MNSKSQKEIIKEWDTLSQFFDTFDNIEGTFENAMAISKQAENLAKILDPRKYEEVEAERMRAIIEPHFEGTVRKSGDLYISRDRIGTHCLVYFVGKKE